MALKLEEEKASVTEPCGPGKVFGFYPKSSETDRRPLQLLCEEGMEADSRV